MFASACVPTATAALFYFELLKMLEHFQHRRSRFRHLDWSTSVRAVLSVHVGVCGACWL